jgi:hypothetical protein
MDTTKLRELATTRKLYRNNGTKNLALVMLAMLEEDQNKPEHVEVKPVAVKPVEVKQKPVEVKPVEVKPVEPAVVVKPVEPVVEVKPVELSEVEPVVEVKPVELSEVEPIVDIPEADATESDTETELDLSDEEPEVIAVEEDKEKVQIGSYDYETAVCPKCEKLREADRQAYMKDNGTSVIPFNFFRLHCKKCTRVKYESYRKTKDSKKLMDKAIQKNAQKKAEVQTTTNKITEIQQLKNARTGKIDTGKMKKDVVESLDKSGNFHLNLYVK